MLIYKNDSLFKSGIDNKTRPNKNEKNTFRIQWILKYTPSIDYLICPAFYFTPALSYNPLKTDWKNLFYKN